MVTSKKQPSEAIDGATVIKVKKKNSLLQSVSKRAYIFLII